LCCRNGLEEGRQHEAKGHQQETRFEIFKRDGMKCRYCGNGPQVSPLVVDHVIAVANGGSDDPSNLATACVDCNGGKSDVPLDERKFRAEQLDEATREQAEQIREYARIHKDIAEAKRELVDEAVKKWCSVYPEPRPAYVTAFARAIGEFGLAKTLEALDIVIAKETPRRRAGRDPLLPRDPEEVPERRQAVTTQRRLDPRIHLRLGARSQESPGRDGRRPGGRWLAG
jgi:hypothetical protein